MKMRDWAASPKPKRRPAFARHSRKCAVCAHPCRSAIEAAFLRFESVAQIALDHGIPGSRPIYRHAHALGLFNRRNRALGSSLGVLLEKADRIVPSAFELIRAAEMFSKIDEHGATTMRPRCGQVRPSTRKSSSASVPRKSSVPPPDSNRHNSEVESTANHSKQRVETSSNQHKSGGSVLVAQPLLAVCFARADRARAPKEASHPHVDDSLLSGQPSGIFLKLDPTR
jgi:hypothetical protein